MATFAARSVLRSVRGATAARLSGTVKPKAASAASSPFRISSQKPLSARIFRSPVEMSSVNVMSMLPYHTATASAVLTSMLSAAPRTHSWTLEVHFVIVQWMSASKLLPEALFCFIVIGWTNVLLTLKSRFFI